LSPWSASPHGASGVPRRTFILIERPQVQLRHLSTNNLPPQHHRRGFAVDCGVIPQNPCQLCSPIIEKHCAAAPFALAPRGRGAVTRRQRAARHPGGGAGCAHTPPPLPYPPTPPPHLPQRRPASVSPAVADSGAFRRSPHGRGAVPRRRRAAGRPRGDAAAPRGVPPAPAACRRGGHRPPVGGGWRPRGAPDRGTPPRRPRAPRARLGNVRGGRRARGGRAAARRPWRQSGRAKWRLPTGPRWGIPSHRARPLPRARARPPAGASQPVLRRICRLGARDRRGARIRASGPVGPAPTMRRAGARRRWASRRSGGAAAAVAARGLRPQRVAGGPPTAGGRRVAVVGRAQLGRLAALSARPSTRCGEARVEGRARTVEGTPTARGAGQWAPSGHNRPCLLSVVCSAARVDRSVCLPAAIHLLSGVPHSV